jgi:hypothetical protein
MSGKAISRALHGHFLVEAVLVNKLITAVLLAKLESNKEIVENDTERLHEEERNLEGVEKISLEDVQRIRDLYSIILHQWPSLLNQMSL